MKTRLALLLLACAVLHAETGRDAWLRYAPLSDIASAPYKTAVPVSIKAVGTAPAILSAKAELIRGVKGMLGRTLRAADGTDSRILIGTIDDLRASDAKLPLTGKIPEDGYWLKMLPGKTLVIAGGNDRGVLYGAFALLRKIATGDAIALLDEHQAPFAPVRWLNHWDNLNGTIERGYGGLSLFWENRKARADLSRAGEYGRLLASLGINGISISNVNADPTIMDPDFFRETAKIAAAFRPWGVRIAVSVAFESPQSIGKLDTFDPLDPKVIAWWKEKFDEMYQVIPDLGGVVLKADSEGRKGPSTYNRSHADAANVVARAIKPHGGLFFYRGFVYDNHMDWNNLKLDRARAADDNFRSLDGKFDDNVLIQIKNGPIDFQVREPASPLFGTLEKTNQVMEVQITQEYMGQGRHTVFLAPMWKEALDFDMHAKGATPTPVKALIAGKVFGRPTGGIVGVSNAGLDNNWYGNHMSQANLYAFGRLAWNPDLTSKQINDEWTTMTFGPDPAVKEVVSSIQLSSWRTYENYTGPLGLQNLTAIAGIAAQGVVGNHYGLSVDASENNGWGQWHRADAKAIGMDRSSAGTGYAQQYRAANAKMFEAVATTPDDMVLFFHHLPYTHVLHSGKTVIQTIYDMHYDGKAAVDRYVKQWSTLKGKVDDQRYEEVLAQLQYQAGQAEVWRDGVNNYFHRLSEIADAKGRVGNHPGRTEGEAMKLAGYTVTDTHPWEGGSGGKAVQCPVTMKDGCAASFEYKGAAALAGLRVRYFDQSTGVAKFRVLVAGQVVDEWSAPDRISQGTTLDAGTSAMRVISGIALRPGDEIRIEGTPDGREVAGIDYVDVVQ